MNTLGYYIDIIIESAQALLHSTLTEKQTQFVKTIIANAERFIHIATEFESLPLEKVSADLRHELGNPLTPIYGYAELLKVGMMGDVDSEQQAHVIRILDSTAALRVLVDHLVAKAREAANQSD
ncbi:MAG: hypothetical protein Kow00117_07520 [Phototrophicales bacterium]